MSKIRSTPEIENIYLKALELCEKYELDKTKPMIDALSEMYRLGAVYAVKSMNETLNPNTPSSSSRAKSLVENDRASGGEGGEKGEL